MKEKTKDIKRFKITCLKCKSKFILKTGKQLYVCPVCGRDWKNTIFDINMNYDDVFFCLSNILKVEE